MFTMFLWKKKLGILLSYDLMQKVLDGWVSILTLKAQITNAAEKNFTFIFFRE